MLEITNCIIDEIKRLSVDLDNNKNFDIIVATNIKAYKYKWKYEDFVAFEEFQNWQENWKFIIAKQDWYEIKDNDLIIIWNDKYLIKNSVLQTPDWEFYNFYQIISFKNND